MTLQQEFWKWFVEHQTELMNFEVDRERVFDQLGAQLQRVDPDLTFEFGPKGPRREFVISAGGVRRAFPSVSTLVAAAPSLEQWQVTGFRPRREPSNVIELAGKCVHPKNVQFSLLDDGKIPGIYLFIPGYTEGDSTLKQIGYLLLDDALASTTSNPTSALLRYSRQKRRPKVSDMRFPNCQDNSTS